MRLPWVILLARCAFVGCTLPPLKVTVFYEALCPDSVRFFTTQLKPAYPLVGNRILLDFVPYGKASHFKRDGKWTFRCHHGPTECYANQVQACAVHQQDISQQSKLDFLVCLMSGSRSSLVNPTFIQNCAQKHSLSSSELFACLRGDLKDTLLLAHGRRTLAADPLITFVPTIVFGDVYDPHLQADALDNFLATVCHQLPGGCPATA